MNRPEGTDAPTLLFIYGTLKRGHCRAPVLIRQRCLGAAQTRPIYRLFNCGTYPGLVRAGQDDGLSVEGELWEIDDDCLALLDDEEGIDKGLYERMPIEIEGKHQHADAYLYLHDTKLLADCGGNWSLQFERSVLGE